MCYIAKSCSIMIKTEKEASSALSMSNSFGDLVLKRNPMLVELGYVLSFLSVFFLFSQTFFT